MRKCYGPLHKGAEIEDEKFTNPKAKACKACCAKYARDRRAKKGDILRKQARDWKAANKLAVDAYSREYTNVHSDQRRDSAHIWAQKIENRVWAYMRYQVRAIRPRCFHSFAEVAGCNRLTLFFHLQGQFKPGMGEKNFRSGVLKWEIGLVNQFDLGTNEGQLKAFHFTNLKPVWSKKVGQSLSQVRNKVQ